MGTIFYSMAGEGRGHAARVRALVEELQHEHQFFLYCPRDAYNFLAPRYEDHPHVVVRRIPGLVFHYRGKRLDYATTVSRSIDFLFHFRSLVRRLVDEIERERPDLIITDFEPALPAAAKKVGMPFLSLDHQHFLTACDLSSLPPTLRLNAWSMAYAVKAYYRGEAETVVSSFFFPPLRQGQEDVVQIGSLLRPEIREAKSERGDHFIAYLRRRASTKVLDLLRTLPSEVRVYGLGERMPEGNLNFKKIDERQFVEDLATADAVVGAAGNQTLGEALYLQKPVLALPEANHFEQRINAHYLREMGAGDYMLLEAASSRRIDKFLDRRDAYRSRIDPERLDGNPKAIAIIRKHLAAATKPTQPDHSNAPVRP
ncbi:undecaprenyldiphospho-muramoylpentapeptide beta-N-acetylglucosaminyltransferase [Planctomycetes bacterium Pan216]|uniref:Undecaprenyldiphospho-muramoylpentapeptide beta-N-acetylglucosaminyltransferase n=1 Tax=Kolteria novifilia TaxID=2527975 RepID=A0A518BCF4_9BACT|nr:undecaprenyldiphospho-muramoylpentapeptide beta-N-acetylglucosaminyltransferase [Planctomycetes bacterium Pan216]